MIVLIESSNDSVSTSTKTKPKTITATSMIPNHKTTSSTTTASKRTSTVATNLTSSDGMKTLDNISNHHQNDDDSFAVYDDDETNNRFLLLTCTDDDDDDEVEDSTSCFSASNITETSGDWNLSLVSDSETTALMLSPLPSTPKTVTRMLTPNNNNNNNNAINTTNTSPYPAISRYYGCSSSSNSSNSTKNSIRNGITCEPVLLGGVVPPISPSSVSSLSLSSSSSSLSATYGGPGTNTMTDIDALLREKDDEDDESESSIPSNFSLLYHPGVHSNDFTAAHQNQNDYYDASFSASILLSSSFARRFDGTASSITLTSTAHPSPRRTVRFHNVVSVREHNITVGSHCATDEPCPIQLSWEYNHCTTTIHPITPSRRDNASNTQTKDSKRRNNSNSCNGPSSKEKQPLSSRSLQSPSKAVKTKLDTTMIEKRKIQSTKEMDTVTEKNEKLSEEDDEEEDGINYHPFRSCPDCDLPIPLSPTSLAISERSADSEKQDDNDEPNDVQGRPSLTLSSSLLQMTTMSSTSTLIMENEDNDESYNMMTNHNIETIQNRYSKSSSTQVEGPIIHSAVSPSSSLSSNISVSNTTHSSLSSSVMVASSPPLPPRRLSIKERRERIALVHGISLRQVTVLELQRILEDVHQVVTPLVNGFNESISLQTNRDRTAISTTITPPLPPPLPSSSSSSQLQPSQSPRAPSQPTLSHDRLRTTNQFNIVTDNSATLSKRKNYCVGSDIMVCEDHALYEPSSNNNDNNELTNHKDDDDEECDGSSSSASSSSMMFDRWMATSSSSSSTTALASSPPVIPGPTALSKPGGRRDSLEIIQNRHTQIKVSSTGTPTASSMALPSDLIKKPPNRNRSNNTTYGNTTYNKNSGTNNIIPR